MVTRPDVAQKSGTRAESAVVSGGAKTIPVLYGGRDEGEKEEGEAHTDASGD